MKQNTELFSKYLENNELPEIFNEIEGFSELFIANYCDSEICFETETLFSIKLNMYSNIYIPQF